MSRSNCSGEYIMAKTGETSTQLCPTVVLYSQLYGGAHRQESHPTSKIAKSPVTRRTHSLLRYLVLRCYWEPARWNASCRQSADAGGGGGAGAGAGAGAAWCVSSARRVGLHHLVAAGSAVDHGPSEVPLEGQLMTSKLPKPFPCRLSGIRILSGVCIHMHVRPDHLERDKTVTDITPAGSIAAAMAMNIDRASHPVCKLNSFRRLNSRSCAVCIHRR